MVQVGTDINYGEEEESVNRRLDFRVGSRSHGTLVQISRANAPIPTAETLRNVVGNTSQVSVGTTATRIAGANPFRKSLKITNVTGTQLIYLGFSNAVSSSTGDYLHSAAGSNTTIDVSGEIWGIAITGAQTVSVMESEYEH